MKNPVNTKNIRYPEITVTLCIISINLYVTLIELLLSV